MFWTGKTKKVKCPSCETKSYVPSIASFTMAMVFADIIGIIALLLIKDRYNLSWAATAILAFCAVVYFRLLDFVFLQPQNEDAKIQIKFVAMWAGSFVLLISGLNWVLTHV